MIRVTLDHASVAFTTRRGGVSRPPYDTLNLGTFTEDNPDALAENLHNVRTATGVQWLHMLHQVHGGSIHDVVGPRPNISVDADAMITSVPHQGLLITGADCPPVAIASADKLAVLHCGWRPLAAGLIENAIARFDGAAIQAAVGPGISQANYEVGNEVVEALGEDGAAAFEDGHLCLRQVINAKLERAGAEQIANVDRCTYAEPDEFFSHRRDGARTGRQAGIAWRN
jgi:YfiH family protein